MPKHIAVLQIFGSPISVASLFSKILLIVFKMFSDIPIPVSLTVIDKLF